MATRAHLETSGTAVHGCVDDGGQSGSLAKRKLPHRVADRLRMRDTTTKATVKHTALGTFKQVRMFDSDGFRLRAATCALWRKDDDVQICLISRVNLSSVHSTTVRWKMPGGGLEVGETVQEAAVRETVEEAGLRGRPVLSLGVYQDDVKHTRTHWWVLHVDEEMETWEEGKLGRKRRWFSVDEAASAVETKYHRRLIEEAGAAYTALPVNGDGVIATLPPSEAKIGLPPSTHSSQHDQHHPPPSHGSCDTPCVASPPSHSSPAVCAPPLRSAPSPRCSSEPTPASPSAASPDPLDLPPVTADPALFPATATASPILTARSARDTTEPPPFL